MNNFLDKLKSAQSFVRVSKRDNIVWWQKTLLYLGALLFAFVLAAIFIAIIGKNPFLYFNEVFVGNFKNIIRIKSLIKTIIPLLITSLGIAVAFKLKFWNIGGEGQFMIGAFASYTIALALGDALPKGISTLFVIVFGALCGGLYGLLVAVLKVKFNTNETLLTLMLNYVASALVTYSIFFDYYKKPGNGIPEYKMISENSWMTFFTYKNIPIMDVAIIIALILVAFLFIYFRYSKHGYEIAITGDSINTAKYAGMNVNKITLRTVFLSATLIGLAGSLQLTGIASNHTMSAGITNGVGWTGIIVAWLARLNPIGISVGSILMAMLERGSANAKTAMEMSNAVSGIIQGIILFSVLAFDFFIKYKLAFDFSKFKKKSVSENETEKIAEEN